MKGKFEWCRDCQAWDRRWPEEGKGYCCNEDSGYFLLSTKSDSGCSEAKPFSYDWREQ